ncbi:hypothetical protein [Tenacibaculum sp. SDUM215027]|uniref:hypothetical protein n=1 Tax=Tenacibaculum sp. SDUM215027 TaxID=3422596 RepID=UPI003D313DEB
MTKLKLRRIYAKRKPNKKIDDFQYFEVPLGKEGIVLYVNDRSYLTEPLHGFAQFPGVIEAHKEDIPNPIDSANALTNVKWSYIDYEYIKAIKNLPKGDFNDQWGAWKNEGGNFTVVEYGIQKQYVQAKIIKAVFTDKSQLGKIYWIEAYNYYPEFNNPKLGAFVAIIGNSQVLSTNFSVNKKDPSENGVYKYEDIISLTIKTHLLPNVNTPYHDFAIFEVDIYEYHSDIKMNKTPIRYVQEQTDNQTAYNTNNVINIKIDKKWRDKAKHDKNQPIKYFYAKIKVLHYKNEDAQLGNKAVPINDGILSSHSMGSKVPVIAPNGEQVVVEIEKGDWEKKSFFQISVSHSEVEDAANTYTKTVIADYSTKEELKGQYYFGVYYNTTSELLTQRKFEVQNMIAQVVKNEYTIKNNEHCKFSAIQVEVEGRTPVEVFNENTITTKQADNNINLFEIVAGDKQKKKITITLDGLEAQHYQTESKTKPRCESIGLPSGQKHDKKNVFNTSKFPEQWIDKEDYTLNDNSIELNLGYEYTKDYGDRVLNYLAFEQSYLKDGVFNKNLKNVWVVDYLLKLIKKEKLHQSYAIPISTCRYTNQLIKLNVYPDMKWVINFNYNIKTPIYYKASDNLIDYYSGYSEGDVSTSNNKARKDILDKTISNELKSFTGSKSNFEISVDCEINGSKTIALSKEFGEKFRKMLSPVMWIINTLSSDEEGGLNLNGAKQENKILNKKKGLVARLSKRPMSFTIAPPSLGVGVGIGYGESSGTKVGWELEGRIKANPIIGANVKLDILALGSKFKPWGLILDALDIVSWLTSVLSNGKLEINYELSFTLSASIKLVGADSKDNTDTSTRITYNYATKELDGSVALKGALEGKLLASVSLEVYIKKKKKRSFEGKYLKDKDKEEAAKLGLSAEGKAIVTYMIGKNFGRNDNWDTDFYFSGFSLKITFNAGVKKKKPKIYEIIPSLNESFSLFKNTGETK